MKAGTTWLYDKLKNHPQIHFSYEKELHYFAHYYNAGQPLSIDKRQRRAQKKLAHFHSKPIQKKSIQIQEQWYQTYANGEVNFQWFSDLMKAEQYADNYLADFSNLTCHLSQQNWADLQQKVEHLKVIYILRDPLKRLWSHYKFHLQTTEHQQANHLLQNFNLFKRTLQKDWFIRNASYVNVLTNLTTQLSAKQFKLYYFEDMISEPAEFLADIETFLNIDHLEYVSETLKQKKNPGVDLTMPIEWQQYALTVLHSDIQQLKQLGYWHSSWLEN